MGTRLTIDQLEKMKTHELADMLASVVLLLRRLPDVECKQLVRHVPDIQVVEPPAVKQVATTRSSFTRATGDSRYVVKLGEFMSLHTLLAQRTEASGPIKVGVIGAGKFASMFLTQALNLTGIHVVGVADLAPDRARAALARTGWPEERYAAASFDEALKTGGTHVTDSADKLIDSSGIEVIVEVTGNPIAGAYHAVRSIDAGYHVIMVNVEADCMIGPVLAARARRAGVVYAMAYGDQPALICELVDWCRTVGFDVVAAGKGTKYLPEYNTSTPDTVWSYYGFTDEQLARGDFNPKMFNSFLDGTKSAIEMAAVANGTGLVPQDEGLFFLPCGVDELPIVYQIGRA